MANDSAPIYDPVKAPIKGLASYRGIPQIPIGSGYFKEIKNFRWADTGILMSRGGIDALTAGGPVDLSNSGLSTGSNTSTTLKTNLTSTTNLYADLYVICNGQIRKIVSNTSTPAIFTVTPAWTSIPATNAPFSITSFLKGFQSLTFQGDTGYVAAAFKSPVTGKTKVYFGNDPLYLNLGLVTASSGKYGDTRLSSDANGNDYGCTFAVVHDRFTGLDVLLIQNGYDYPRVWDGTNCSIHKEVDPPVRGNNWYSQPLPSSSVPMANSANWSIPAHSTTDWTFTQNVSTTSAAAFLDTTGASPAGSAAINFASNKVTVGSLAGGVVTRSCRHVIITITGSEENVTALLDNFKIGATGAQSATTKTLYDPTSTVQRGRDGLTLIQGDTRFSIWHILLAVDPIISSNVDYQINQIELTPVGTGSVTSIVIYGICAGGLIPSTGQIAVSYFNPASRAESYEQVLPIRPASLGIDGSGNDAMGLPISVSTWPVDSRLYFEQGIWVGLIDQTQADLGVDTLRIYLKEEGETDFTYLAYGTLATYSSSAWHIASATDSSTGLIQFQVNTEPNSRLLWLTSPSSYMQPIPVGRAMAAGAGSRLVVGARSESQDAFPRVAMSSALSPFRFASLPDLNDQSTAYEDSINGENIQAFVSSAASSFAAATIYCLTDKSLWIVDPVSIGNAYFLRRVATVGTASPRSVTEYRGKIYWLDTNSMIQQFAGATSNPISQGWIDDKLTSIPTARLRNTSGAWFNFRYFMARTPTGGTTNTRAVVYSENARAWESDDEAPAIGVYGAGMTYEALATWQQNTATQTGAYGVIAPAKLIAIGIDNNIYQLEVGTDDLSNDVSTQLTTGAIAAWTGLTIKRLGILIDGLAGKVFNFVRTFWPTGATASSTITTSATDPFDWAWDTTPTITEDSVGSIGYVDVSASLPGGSSIWAIQYEYDDRQTAPRGS